jgi:protease II
MVFTVLFAHLDELKKKLLRKRQEWKKELVSSITLAPQKLSDYYHMTNQQRGKPYH